MNIQIPYGRTRLSLDLPDEQVKAVLAPDMQQVAAAASQEQIVLDAMAAPIDSAPLWELA